MYDTEQSYEPRDMKTEPDPNEPNQLVKPVPKTIDAPEGQLWIQPPRLVRIPRTFSIWLLLNPFLHVYHGVRIIFLGLSNADWLIKKRFWPRGIQKKRIKQEPSRINLVENMDQIYI